MGPIIHYVSWKKKKQINNVSTGSSYELLPNWENSRGGHQPQMCHLQHLHIIQCIGHSNFTHQYSITKNPDIYFQPINRAKPKWGISIEFGSIFHERNKMMTLEFRRLDILQTRS